MPLIVTPIQGLVTKTAASQGAGADVSGVTGNWTLKVRVVKLTAGKTIRFQFTDSTDDFVMDKGTGPTFCFTGEIQPNADVVRTIRQYDAPTLRIGVASAKLRLDITRIDSGASVDYCAWLESA